MLKSLVTLTAVCALAATAPLALAEPGDDPTPVQPVADAPPPPPGDTGAMPSAEPGTLSTPDGWILAVAAKDESLLPVAPLTTALSSREYIVGGTFIGGVKGGGKTKLAGGTLEAGYQIGCGITGGPVELMGGVSLQPSISMAGVPSASAGVVGQIKVGLRPGTVTIVPVNKKTFEGTTTRTTITGFRIKIDGCVGQSFIRSYATFTSSTENTDDVVTYMGITKAV
ncbi:MspA family porin [Mycobacteroides saopaulense]|uniref:MspA protein n=1 Tax=Mycobacteroides saopaulense TaxID=1578165 RepID=A0ABX3BUU8_9MYCO|nr:MspA family porin [Mycobacteroides saopaulense]OHT87836.1 MspA protein [Mycobacteroides saopaulense]OHU06179.1 MspA protein [Mycobacteroides saopaulense]